MSVTLCRHPRRGQKDRNGSKEKEKQDLEETEKLACSEDNAPIQLTWNFAARGLRECAEVETAQPGQGGESVRTLLHSWAMFSVVS